MNAYLYFQYHSYKSVFAITSGHVFINNHLWHISQMNLEERLAKYLERDFSLEQAQILVLMEEAAIALFAALPEHFVLFGGATLVLFHNSPRLSKDLDLLARVDSLPSAGELQIHCKKLLQKAETFVSRRMMKTRDAFDMRLLLAEGAVLDETLKAHLNDLLMWRELDAEQINERIEQVTPKLCRAELKSVLPEEVYSSLEGEEFESLRVAVRTLFAKWL